MKISLCMFLIYLGRHYQYRNNLANPSMVNFIQIKKKIGITSLILELVKFPWKLLIIRQVILITSITWSIWPSLKNCFVCHLPNEEKVPHSLVSFTIWAQFFICLWSITTVNQLLFVCKIFSQGTWEPYCRQYFLT